MSCCSAWWCSGCQDEIWEEHRIQKAEARQFTAYLAGETPAFVEDLEVDDDSKDALEFEKGDQMFVTSLHRPAEDIQVTSTVSQCLTEAFKQNSELVQPDPTFPNSREGVPDYLSNFDLAFSKEPLTYFLIQTLVPCDQTDPRRNTL